MTTEEGIVVPTDTASTATLMQKEANDKPLTDDPATTCSQNESNEQNETESDQKEQKEQSEPPNESESNEEEKLKEEAFKVKDEANVFFNNGDCEKAIELYSKAIELYPKERTFYTNRSLAYFKLGHFESSLNDANSAIQINNNFLKGYYRRAMTYMAMTRFKDALRDFEMLMKTNPKDKLYREKYVECNRIVKRIAFEKAIACDYSKTVADLIDLDAMTIEDDYDGPKLKNGKITPEFMEELLEHFRNQKLLHRKYAYEIILKAHKMLKAMPNLVEVEVPDDKKFTVCGDIHGQFYDLLNIFKLNGLPSEENPYLFNGDYVDRGSFSVECVLTLLGFKVLYPNHFFLSRGNHESDSMNQMYGFVQEVRNKYSYQMYELISVVFNSVPLCHLLNKRVLVMHGGLFSEDNVTLDDIRKVDRVRQPPNEGIMCELLWSDPMAVPGRSPSYRGVGVLFGPDVTEAFCEKNNLDYIIRSHEMMANGYKKMHNDRCITVFSAPNYCDTMRNKGAFITMRGPLLKPEFTTFSEVPHPKVRSFIDNSMGCF